MYDQTSAFSIAVLKAREDGGLKAQEFIAKAQEGLPEIIIGKPSFKWDDANSMGGQRFSVQLTGESTEKLAGARRRSRASDVERQGTRGGAIRSARR